MALKRSAGLMIAGTLIAAASGGAVGFHAWREFYSPAGEAAAPGKNEPSAGKTSGPSSAEVHSAAVKPAATPAETSHPAPAKLAATAPAKSGKPSFDVVRVEPNGDSVVAGRAAPNAKVTLLDNGKKLASGSADSGGQFVLIPPRLKAGGHELALRTDSGKKTTASAQSVTVVVPDKGGHLIVAEAAPGAPTKILDDRTAGKAKPEPGAAAKGSAASAPKPEVFIRTVEVGQAGDFFATGTAPPAAALRLYLNDALVAKATAGPKGEWSLRVDKGLRPGSYEVRADDVDPATGRVIARASAPFDFQGFAVAAASSAQGAPGSPAIGASAAVAHIDTVTVVHGDNLWRISRHIFGQGIRYTLIYEANSNQIRNRNLIYPGQVFVVPKG